MRKISTLLFAWAITISALAQQDPLYSQYINNPFVLNPAYAGMTNNLNTSVSYRHQWTGMEGSPVTVNANGHMSLHANTMGGGLMFVSDRIGATAINEGYASFAYRIKVSDDKTISFGLQGGFINFKTEVNKLTIQHSSDPAFAGGASETKPSIGSGIIFTGDKFFIGLSVPRMLRTKATAGGFQSTLYTQHFYAMGSYLFFVSDHIRFRPSVLGKIVSGAPISVDVNAAMILHENYTIGILTRNFSAYGLFLQALIRDSFRIGYTMEVPTGKSVGTQFSTHEVTIGFRMNALKFHDNTGITSF